MSSLDTGAVRAHHAHMSPQARRGSRSRGAFAIVAALLALSCGEGEQRGAGARAADGGPGGAGAAGEGAAKGDGGATGGGAAGTAGSAGTPAAGAGGGQGTAGTASNGGSGGEGGRAAGGSAGSAGAAGSGGAGGSVPLEPGPHFVGRHVVAGDQARFSWPGTGVIVRFDGTGTRATLNDAAQFYTHVIDGVVQSTLQVSGGTQTYDLAAGLPPGVHTVELYRRTEGFFTASTFSGLEVDGTLLGVPLPTRHIEVVGDSITTGYGIDGPDGLCGFSADTENHYLTYAALAARELGAELSAVAWSGKGVVFNFGDDMVDPLPSLYDRIIADEAGTTGAITPADVVVVNLGTNDFSTDGDPTEAQFSAAYHALLDDIRAHHPDAHILCTVGPILLGDDEVRASDYTKAVIAERVAGGDTKIEWFDFGVSMTDIGCDYHPGVETNAAMATSLVSVIRNAVGW